MRADFGFSPCPQTGHVPILLPMIDFTNQGAKWRN